MRNAQKTGKSTPRNKRASQLNKPVRTLTKVFKPRYLEIESLILLNTLSMLYLFWVLGNNKEILF